MWLVGALVMLANAAMTKSQSVRRIAVVLTSLSFAMIIVETGFSIYSKAHPLAEVIYDPPFEGHGFYTPDSELGYKMISGAHVRARKLKKGRVIYDAHYTLDTLGRRLTEGNQLGPTVVFMGCSYTFGEGVNDTETLPSYFSAAMGNRMNVVNLGGPGHGPHQMLRLLELSPPAVPPRASVVVYQAILYHVRRTVGRADWDLAGPKYVRSGDTVARAGPFYSPRMQGVIGLLRRSDFFRIMSDRLYFNERFTDADLETYARIVEQSARVANRKLGAKFVIVFWDENNDAGKRVLRRLQKTELPLILVSTIIPRAEWTQVRLPGDLHPAAEAYRRIALALAARFAHERF